MTNVEIVPPPANRIKVRDNDYGIEHMFSIGYIKDCIEFWKIFDSKSGLTCECDLFVPHAWYYVPGNADGQNHTNDGIVYLSSCFHDHRLCSGQRCKYEDLMKVIHEIEGGSNRNYKQQIFACVRYVFPRFDTEDPFTIANFIRHKIKQDVAIEPIEDVSSNWFSCCGVCNSAIIYKPSVTSTTLHGKAIWSWKDCPWDRLIAYKLPYDTNGNLV